MYIPQWHNGEDACTLSNLETPFSTLCKSFVFHLILKNVSMLCLKKKRGLILFGLFFIVMLKEEFWLLLLMEQYPYSTEIQVYIFSCMTVIFYVNYISLFVLPFIIYRGVIIFCGDSVVMNFMHTNLYFQNHFNVWECVQRS